MNQTTKQPTEIFAASIATILDAVGEEHDREREIIVRRFGLKERRETLEQASCSALRASASASSRRLSWCASSLPPKQAS